MLPGMTDIACTLSPARVPGRLALIEGLARDALVDQEPIPGGVRSRFRAAAESRVRRLAGLESRCCAFLDFTIARDGEAIVLDITGPPEARPVIEQLFAMATTRSRL
jgi:hypothetical protein